MRLTISTGLALLTSALLASAAFAQTSPARDWLVPPPILLDRIEELATPSGAPAPCPTCGTSVSYTAFDNAQYTLTRYAGRHTEWLLPASWIAVLSANELRLLLERSDWLYEHARELVGREPTGAGRIAFAVIPTTCGYGCGWIGAKGVEIDDEALDDVRDNLTVSVLARVVVHELVHNFDVYHGYLFPSGGNRPDAHAWTELLEHYFPAYSRAGTLALAPDDIVAEQVRTTHDLYVADPGNDWSNCIAGGGPCTVTANQAWAGATLRFVQLHGALSLRRAFEEVRASASGGFPSLQGAADLHFGALARGAGRNIGCYVGPWRWSVSPAALSALAALPSTQNCTDSDADGFTPLAGDCADSNAARHPNATEIQNAADDDCNGAVDDLWQIEGGDFPADLLVTLPTRIAGFVDAADDDVFQFQVTGTSNFSFTLCSQGFEGHLFFEQISGFWNSAHYVNSGTCVSKAYAFSQTGFQRFALFAHNAATLGPYTIAARNLAPWPVAPWGTATAPTINQCTIRLRTSTANLATASKTPNRARFFVEGIGSVGESGFGATSSLAWLPGRNTSGTYQYRAQLMNGKEPVTDWSAPMTFAFSEPAGGCGAPCDDGIDNDGDGLTDWPSDPACRFAGTATESPACDDGLDNDGDGARDWDGAGVGAADSYCNNPWVTAEAPPPSSCGFGPELALLVPLLAGARALRRRAHR